MSSRYHFSDANGKFVVEKNSFYFFVANIITMLNMKTLYLNATLKLPNQIIRLLNNTINKRSFHWIDTKHKQNQILHVLQRENEKSF